MPAILSVLALFLAAVLAAASIHKIVERRRLALATENLLQLSPAIAMPLTMAAAAIEATAALALVIPEGRAVGALLAALLWIGYGITLFRARRRGDRGIDCGCDFGARRTGIGRFAVIRAFALSGGALILLASPVGGSGFDVVSLFAASAFLALLFAAGELSHLPISRRSAAR